MFKNKQKNKLSRSLKYFIVAALCCICSIILYHQNSMILFIAYLVMAITSICFGLFFKRLEVEKSKYGYREYLLHELKKDETNLLQDDKVHGRKQKAKDKNTVDCDVINTKWTSQKDILVQMLDNNDEIKEYFRISKSQAKSSFWFSVFACVVGVLMLALAIYGVIAINNLQIAIIGTVSGAITEVISGTVLWIHNKSALQLNHYYNALHENEKFLSAINIADKLNDEKREEMYIEIIRKQIETHNTEREIHSTEKNT